MFFPLNLILSWISLFWSLFLFAVQFYCLRQWYYQFDNWERYLALAGVILVFQIVGGPLVALLLSKQKSDQRDDLYQDSTNSKKQFDETTNSSFTLSSKVDSKYIIIAIHGWGTNRNDWSYISPKLNEQSEVLYWDLPGLGASPKPEDENYELSNYASKLKELIEKQTKPVILMGHSIGGMIILTLAGQYPSLLGNQVSKMILIHTTYTNPSKTALFSGLLTAIQEPILKPMLWVQIALSPLFRLANILSYFNGAAFLATALTGFGGHQTRGQLDLATRFISFAPIDVASRGMLAMFRYDAENILQRIQIPTLIITGTKDRLTKPEASHWMNENIQYPTLVTNDGGGHMGTLERHEKISQEIISFISS